MPARDSDGALPYMTPLSGTEPAQSQNVTKTDVANYDTLKRVHGQFKEAMIALHRDFNAFEVLGPDTDQKIIETMMRNIAGRQVAFDVLSPLYASLDTAVQAIDNNFKTRN